MVETKQNIPKKKFFMVVPFMMKVVYATIPLLLAGIYLFGWRVLALTAVVFIAGIFAEWSMASKRNSPVHSSVFVSCILFTLTLPPTTPFWIAAVGIIFGIIFGKEVFGGFGRNAFNPALVGRCFIYISFPKAMTAQFIEPATTHLYGLKIADSSIQSWYGALDRWINTDWSVFTSATPLNIIKKGEGAVDTMSLIFGNTSGSIGETSAILVILCGAYLLYTKTASWKTSLSCLAGAATMSTILWLSGVATVPDPLITLVSGGLLFGAFFMVTDPVSACQTKYGMFVYGAMIGILTVIIRGYSNFMGGVMFAILFMNMFAPTIDIIFRSLQNRKKSAPKA